MSKPSAKKTADKVFTPSGFKELAKGRLQAIENKVGLLEQSAKKFFVPHIAKSIRKGRSYYLQGTGTVSCTDKSVMEITGMGPVGTMRFEQLYAKNPVRQIFTSQTILKAAIRELADERTMDGIEEFLAKGKTEILLTGRNPSLKKSYVEACLRSINPFILAHVACYVFGEDTREMSQTGIAYIAEGNRALELLAGEYAAAQGATYDQALKRLADAAGKPSLDDVMGFSRGYSPYDARAVRGPK